VGGWRGLERGAGQGWPGWPSRRWSRLAGGLKQGPGEEEKSSGGVGRMRLSSHGMGIAGAAMAQGEAGRRELRDNSQGEKEMLRGKREALPVREGLRGSQM